MKSTKPGIRLQLPGTSANLGPAFDAAGLALSLHLTVEAHASAAMQVHATGRNADLCAARENNLLLDTYKDVLVENHRPATPLSLNIHNEIPLGMGCGSSAAALLAGIALASHFGDLRWDDARIVAEASRREGHPDNVAACWYGGFTVSAEQEGRVAAVTFAGDPYWDLMLLLPETSLSTKTARALLPEYYSKTDAVFNVQRAALLTAAMAQRRLDLLSLATQDRFHQPYRADVCPLLPIALSLSGEPEFAASSLSGAGPSVLMFLAENVTLLEAESRLANVLPAGVEVLPLRIAEGVRIDLLPAS